MIMDNDKMLALVRKTRKIELNIERLQRKLRAERKALDVVVTEGMSLLALIEEQKSGQGRLGLVAKDEVKLC